MQHCDSGNTPQIQLCVWNLKARIFYFDVWALTSCALLLLSSVVSSSIRFLLGSDLPWVTAPGSVLSDGSGCGGLDGGAAGGSSSSRQKGWTLGISGPASWEAVWMGLHRNNNRATMMCCHGNRQVRWFSKTTEVGKGFLLVESSLKYFTCSFPLSWSARTRVVSWAGCGWWVWRGGWRTSCASLGLGGLSDALPSPALTCSCRQRASEAP